ncbi:hypothetical protein [Azospirillum halopraeferens]|uniref:hypothetical protein n=1 Tax=Azospirillum halopraeferens TaxID=34010 RepID=UPI0012EB3F71|nr:hypothetical protein [Azospirillum halopraeferens]
MEQTPASVSGTESKRRIQIRVPPDPSAPPEGFERGTTIAVVFKIPNIPAGEMRPEAQPAASPPPPPASRKPLHKLRLRIQIRFSPQSSAGIFRFGRRY